LENGKGSLAKGPANRYALFNLIRPREIGRLRAVVARGRRRGVTGAYSSGGAARNLAGVGDSGATEGHSGFCLVQKDVYATSNPLEGTGWLFWARPWLAVARGGPGRRRAVRSHWSTPFPALRGSFRPVFGSGEVSALRVTHLGTGLGSGRSMAALVSAAADRHGETRRRAGAPRVARATARLR
jgi:hypothetical protein